MSQTEEVVSQEAGGSLRDEMVSVQDVTKIYQGQGESVTALKDIDLDVREGEFLSIVGPSGCGKTTLLHLAAGLLSPSEGKVTVDGVDVQTPAHEKNNVGLVFQHPVLLEWRTVIQNIMLPIQIMVNNGTLEGDKEEFKEYAYDLIDLVGLDGFADSYPQELSGGMQQRVSICQSLVYDPAVLLMDEPFGSLDAMTKQQLNAEFLKIWNEQKKTVLFVTHDLEEAVFLSDRVVVMTPRPGEIEDTFDITIDRPRTEDTRTSEEYHQLVSKAYKYFTG